MKRKNTCTTIFMVPTLKNPKDSLKNNGFINAYIEDEMSDSEYKDCIYVLFKPDDVDLFKDFLDNEYERTKQIVEDYDFNKTNDLIEYWQEKIGTSSTWKDEYEVWSGFDIENETLTKKVLNESRKNISRKS